LNLESSLDFLINQGPVFWAATASVGTGGALLITALYIYVRRLARNDRFKLSRIRRTPSESISSAARPEIQVTESEYSLSAGSAVKEQMPTPTTAPLGELLNRLRAAGDRLEEAVNPGEYAGSTHSTLKTSLIPVEYESKAGIG
jgi:hypothetical protein